MPDKARTETILLWECPSEPTGSPRSADDFARIVIRAICDASVAPRVGRMTYERCLRALYEEATVRVGFRHPGKAQAVDRIWRERVRLFRAYSANADKVAFLGTLPWIGPITATRLATRLGLGFEPTNAGQQAA